MLHKYSYCTYHTTVKYNLRRHIKNKHGNHPNSAQPVAASNPHPYVHPYLNNVNQQPDARPQRTPEMVANNTYYAEETRAPTKISVGPNGPRAPTTFSVPPQIGGVQDGSGILICPSTRRNWAFTNQNDTPGPVKRITNYPTVPLYNYIPRRTYLAGGTKWPQFSWAPGMNGFPVGKQGKK